MASIRALSRHEAARLAVQRTAGQILSPVTTLAVHGFLRAHLQLTLEDPGEIRNFYRDLNRDRTTPLLLCANHLTLIDSALIAWALGDPLGYVTRFRNLPWNLPEARNFAKTRIQRAMTYVYKCLPITRGGARSGIATTLAQFTHILNRGDTGLVFPEAGRSRTGRVEVDNAAYGVGRVVRALPDCRVLCVYLRGDRQQSYSDFPTTGDHLRTRVRLIEPKTDHRGVRGSLDIARQITQTIADLESEHFLALGPTPLMKEASH